MHLLGKNFKAFAITLKDAVINLIQINSLDFNWQMTYQFDKRLKIPKGSVTYAEAEYDNTRQNGRFLLRPTTRNNLRLGHQR